MAALTQFQSPKDFQQNLWIPSSTTPTTIQRIECPMRWFPRNEAQEADIISFPNNTARYFIQLLASPHCTLAAVVQSLDIQFVSGSQRWFSEFCRRLIILNKTNNISVLTISGSRNTVICEEARAALSTFPNQVTKLTVGAVMFETLADFVSVLCSLTSLQSLSCAAHYQVPADPRAGQITGPLQSVNLESPSTNLLFEFLLLQGILPTVTTPFIFPSRSGRLSQPDAIPGHAKRYLTGSQ